MREIFHNHFVWCHPVFATLSHLIVWFACEGIKVLFLGENQCSNSVVQIWKINLQSYKNSVEQRSYILPTLRNWWILLEKNTSNIEKLQYGRRKLIFSLEKVKCLFFRKKFRETFKIMKSVKQRFLPLMFFGIWTRQVGLETFKLIFWRELTVVFLTFPMVL